MFLINYINLFLAQSNSKEDYQNNENLNNTLNRYLKREKPSIIEEKQDSDNIQSKENDSQKQITFSKTSSEVPCKVVLLGESGKINYNYPFYRSW